MNEIQNRVLDQDYRPASNFFEADLILRDYLDSRLSAQGCGYMLDKWQRLGEQAAQVMDALSLTADQEGPRLRPRNFLGERTDEIVFHPAYWQLMQIALDSEMFHVKWAPELRARFGEEGHRLGFVSGFLFALSELGQYCPLCMTDGVARLIERYAEPEDRERLLPHIYSLDLQTFHSGAMFLTEKSGGSDVGRNLVRAEQVEGRNYILSGEKWFCSNANAQLIFALARTEGAQPGTRGLSIFLLEKPTLPIVRLKDKLGVRSMASAECILDQTPAKLIGEEFQGFKIMTEMINLSRLYNAVAALSGTRRALVEAYTFLRHRQSFGRCALEHALVRDKLFELGTLYLADFYLTWRSIEALDAADTGDQAEAQRLRLLTPMTKKWTAEKGVYICREAMELMGGLGYIEDGVMPKILRDVLVLPIWEGAGNIMSLDMLRAASRSEGLSLLFADIAEMIAQAPPLVAEAMQTKLQNLQTQAPQLAELPAELRELRAKYFFENLTTLYQMQLLLRYRHEDNAPRMDLGLEGLNLRLQNLEPQRLLSRLEIETLLGWAL